ncbi:hypothetical protein ACFL2O_00910 [Thermodesulfobacteriota bacterium]
MKSIKNIKKVEQTQIRGANQCVVSYSINNQDEYTLYTSSKEKGNWKIHLVGGIKVLRWYDPLKNPMLISMGGIGKNNSDFVAKFHDIKDKNEKSKYVINHQGQTITITGTLTSISAGGIQVYYDIDLPGVDAGKKARHDLSVILDKSQFLYSTIDASREQASFTYFDSPQFMLKKSQPISVTGFISGTYDNNLIVAGAVFNE